VLINSNTGVIEFIGTRSVNSQCYIPLINTTACLHIDIAVNARASCAGGREFESQRPTKSYTVVRHRLNIYAGSCVALALWCRDGHRKLVTRFGVILRVSWKVWLWFGSNTVNFVVLCPTTTQFYGQQW